MKQYYGLRLMSFFYQALAVVISLISIASIGYILVEHFVLQNGDTTTWTTRAISFLAIGGGLSLTCYVIAQLLDSQITTLKAVYRLHDLIPHMEQLKASNEQLVKQLEIQKTMLNSLGAVAPTEQRAIQKQIQDRRRRIELDETN